MTLFKQAFAIETSGWIEETRDKGLVDQLIYCLKEVWIEVAEKL